MITVLGHINPDTDTTCSAIAYAWFLNTHGKHATPVRTGNLNKETLFVLEHFGVEQPLLLEELTGDHTIAIVDTNNPEELLPGWEESTIVSIIDHHKLVGGIHTPDPITITMEPVASTATIILGIMEDTQIAPSKEIAGILLSAILSDTLKFTSPTTTEVDRQAAEHLAKIAEVSVDDFASAMFAAKSDLTGMSIDDILSVDSKVFTLSAQKCMVSVLETTNPEHALSRREEIEAALRAKKEEQGINVAMFFVIDILNTEATLIVPSDDERFVAENAFNISFTEEVLRLPGIVSRKKQIIPELERVLTPGGVHRPAMASVDDTVFFPEIIDTNEA